MVAYGDNQSYQRHVLRQKIHAPLLPKIHQDKLQVYSFNLKLFCYSSICFFKCPLSEAKLEKQTKGFAILLMGNEHLGFSLLMGLTENEGEFFSSLRNKAGLT